MKWNPAQEFAKDDERLPIEAPPCAGCVHWRPARQYDSRGSFIGVRLCQADEMSIDFSCFAPAKVMAEEAALP